MRTYLFVTPSSILHQLLVAHQDNEDATRRAMMDFAERHNLKIDGFKASGIVTFEDGVEPGKDWKKERKGGYSPRLTTPNGKAYKAEMDNIPSPPGWWNLIDAVIAIHPESRGIMDANTHGTIHFQLSPDRENFFVCCSPHWIPSMEGIEELTLTEYKARFERLAEARKEQEGGQQ